MKGLILSGGAGTRLRPITHTSAKQLVPVANKPILFYGIEDMAAAGITRSASSSATPGTRSWRPSATGPRFGVKVTYIPQDEPLGLAHCVLIARDFLGDDDFVMYLGDNMLQQGLEGFVERFEAARARCRRAHPRRAALTLRPRRSSSAPCPTRTASASPRSTSAVTSSASSRSPLDPPSNLALVGVYLFTPAIHEAVAAIEPSEPGRAGDHRRHPVAHRPRHASCATRSSRAGGSTPARRTRCSSPTVGSWRPSSPASTAPSTRRRRSTAASSSRRAPRSSAARSAGPSIIGAGTRVVNSYVGPFTAIAEGCEIIDSEVEHSVVLDRSRIVGVARLMDSLIGRDVEVKPSPERPRGHPSDGRRPLRHRALRVQRPSRHGHHHAIRRHRRRLRRRPGRATATNAATSSRPTAGSGSRRAAR